MRFGKWESIKNTSLSAPTIVPITSQKIAIPDAEIIEAKKMVKINKHLQVVNVLKETVGNTIIIKRIFDLEINLMVS